MDNIRNKWLLVVIFGLAFSTTLVFSYGPGYLGLSTEPASHEVNVSPVMSSGDMVTNVVTLDKEVTNINVPSMSPSQGVSAKISNKSTVGINTTMTPVSSPRVTLKHNSGDIVINEVGWMGTKASQYAEWIELYNNTSNRIDLSNWKIIDALKGTTIIGLSGSIQANGYYILERTTVSSPHVFKDIVPNISGQFGGGGLSNSGENLILQDQSGSSIDVVSGSSNWFGAGKSSPEYKTMERVDSSKAGSIPNNWATNNGSVVNGHDMQANPISGTPGSKNSVTLI